MARLGPLPAPVLALVRRAARLRRLRAGEAFLAAGARWTQLCWVQRGGLRLFYLDRQGAVANKNFHLAGSLLWPLTPALARAPVDFWIEALTPTELWCLPWADWQQVVAVGAVAVPAPAGGCGLDPALAGAGGGAGVGRDEGDGGDGGQPPSLGSAGPWPAWQDLTHQTLAALLDDKMRREQQFLQCSATERYQALCAERPDWLAQVPLRHLASYLGITDVALSRIRRRLLRGRADGAPGAEVVPASSPG